MRKRNYPLIIGTIILLLLMLVLIFGDYIAKIDPFALNIGKLIDTDESLRYIKPPFAPNDTYVLGTDMLGRDILSRIIYGARNTLKLVLIATTLRFLIAMPFAFLGGFKNKITSSIIKYFSTVFSSVPALVISLTILSIGPIKELDLNESIIAFSIVITFVEWGRLAKVLENKIKDILNMNFIKGEIAIGKNNAQIAFGNVFPHLVSYISIYFFIEMGRTLIIIAQLGVFGVYVGKNGLNMGEITSELGLSIIPEYFPEWGGMLATTRYALSIKKPWMILYTLLAFFITILGLNMFGEGLKIEINKRKSMALTYINRTLNQINPLTYIYEIRNYKKYKRRLYIKTSIIVMLLVIPLMPVKESMFKANSQSIFKHIEEFNNEMYDGRFVGSKGNENTQNYIIKELKNNNIKPLFIDNYVEEFLVDDFYNDIYDSKIYINDDFEEIVEEFDFLDKYLFKEFALSKEIIKGKIISFNKFNDGDYDENEKYYVVVNEDIKYSDVHRSNENGKMIRNLAKMKNVEGVIVGTNNFYPYAKKTNINIKDFDEYISAKDNNYLNPFIIWFNKENIEDLLKYEGMDLVLKNEIIKINDLKGKNIGGIIYAKEKTDENIIIITSYDYLGYDKYSEYKGLLYNTSSIASCLEISKLLGNSELVPNKNIVFLFLDSSKYKNKGAKIFLRNHNDLLNDDSFVVFLNDLGLSISDKIYIDNSRVRSNNKYSNKYIKYLKERADEMNLNAEYLSIINENDDSNELLRKTVASGIQIKSTDNTIKYYNDKQNDINLLDKNKIKSQAQLIIDMITYIAY